MFKRLLNVQENCCLILGIVWKVVETWDELIVTVTLLSQGDGLWWQPWIICGNLGRDPQWHKMVWTGCTLHDASAVCCHLKHWKAVLLPAQGECKVPGDMSWRAKTN